ncbi:MAG: TatD family hydrolase [Desulfovibrionaceae bacterium]
MSKKKSSAPKTSPLDLALPLCGVDTHAHLDLEHFGENLEAVLSLARQSGISQIGNVFLGSKSYQDNAPLFAQHPEVFFILGVHPCDAHQCKAQELDALAQAFRSDERLCAVGEIGLDYFWHDCPPEVQKAAFSAQLTLARAVERPVVIHSRDAHDDTLALLEAHGFIGYPLIWHCFGGDTALAHRIINNGWHISIPGPVTYPANAALREAVKSIPLDRLLVETDCPYLAPAEWRGQRNQPAFAVFTAACIAKQRGLDPAELWEICGNNARKFFGIGED